MKSVVVASAVRTAIGNLGGTLKEVLPEELSRIVINQSIDRANIAKEMIDEVILGQSKQTTDAPNISRVASLMAGIPETTPAYTVHRQCGSGMQSIINGVWQIQAGYADIVVVGGVESMSTAPYYIRGGRFGYGAGNGEIIDPNTESQPKSQPEDIYGRFTMGLTAENLVERYNISRIEQDEFAFLSQKKAIDAMDKGKFKDEIVPIILKKKKETIIFDTDEFPRRNSSLEKLSKLRPVFKKDGTVTAGNSSGRNDGAAALILMSEEKAKEFDIAPIGRFVSAGIGGVDPRIMGIGPVPATIDALNRAGLKLDDIDLIELNEAFAGQSLAVIKELNINREILNVNGGAIALGHPIGCTGARIVTTLLHEMKRRDSKYGLATLCIAGGLGLTTIFEKLK
ncbi:thiolase family protein [Wukongibacter baidiensis]|uniref:thiolase family protein n=1 Tax=Wukongibacter baidiensis TaxID=1723361 RepID=UPI003D7FE358